MSTKRKPTNYERGDIEKEFNFPYQRLSWSKKKANKFKWVEQVADYYDHYRGDYRCGEYFDKLKTNYDLFAGRGEDAMRQYHNTYGVDLEMEGLRGGYDDIQHIPMINQIARAMIGEQQRRPLSAVAVDSSKYNMNLRKMKRNELLQNWVTQNILEPINQQAMQSVMQQTGVQDPYMLNPDQQMDFQSMVQEQAKAMTPDEIENYMRKDYKSPTETMAQRLLDFLIQDLNIKYLTDEAFKHMVVSGKEVVRIYKSHGNVKMEVVNPMGFDHGQSQNTHFIEDGEWAKHEQYIRYPDLFNRVGEQLGNKEMRKLEGAFMKYGGSIETFGWNSSQIESGELVATIARNDNNGQIFNNAPDIRTNEGQEFVRNLYGRFGSAHNNYDGIRHVHLAFKALRKFKYITRKMGDGSKQGFWLDESYTLNPSRGDEKEEIVWIPQVWEVDKFGTTEGIYVNKRPLPDQYKSIDNPWDVKLPYIGIEFNRMFENSDAVAPMDFGKPWQYLINVEFAKIQELNATDLGKILITTMGGIPKDWDLGKFHAIMKYSKMALLDTQQEGFNPGIDTSVTKGVDLGNTPEMMGRVQYLQFLFSMMTNSMSYNQTRMGNTSQYQAVSNVQQDIIQSQYQTEDIYNTHNVFLENVLNYVVRVGKSAFAENKKKAMYILDDMSFAELNVDWEKIDPAELGVKIRNSSEDHQRLQQVKGLAQAMVQNGLISMPELIRIIYANNGAEIINAAEFGQKTAEARSQQEMQMQQQMMEMQQQMAAQMEQMRHMMDMQKIELKGGMDYEKAIAAASIDATKFAGQYDINKNQINDQKEIEEDKQEFQEKENEKDRQLEREKMRIDRELELKKIAAKTNSK